MMSVKGGSNTNSRFSMTVKKILRKGFAPAVFTGTDAVSHFKDPAEVGTVIKAPCKSRFGNILMGAGHH